MFSQSSNKADDKQKLTYQEKQFKTELSIKRIFWMAGDFVVVLSYCKQDNDYFLELFRYDQELPVDMVKIYHTENDLKIEKFNNRPRRITVLLLSETDQKDYNLIG